MNRCRLWLVSIGLLAAPLPFSHAGIVTPDSISPTPILTNPVSDTSPIPAGGWVTTQYAGHGVTFDGCALGVINGTKCWLPAVTLVLDPGPGFPNGGLLHQLSYSAAINLTPHWKDPGDLESVSVTFAGLAPGQGVLQAFDSQGNLLGSANAQAAGSVTVATLQGHDFSSFSLSKAGNGTSSPWGVSQLAGTATAPEPGSLTLVAVGLLLLVGMWLIGGGKARTNSR